MSENLLNVEVVDRQATLWLGAASHVSVPATDGSLGILPGRQPVLAVLDNGIVRISANDGTEIKVNVAGGFVSVDADFVTIVAQEGTIVSE